MKQLKLKAKTIKLLRKVAAHILEEPKRVYMNDWAEVVAPEYHASYQSESRSPVPVCNTQGCIAGWTILLNRPKIWRDLLADIGPDGGDASSSDLYSKVGSTDDIQTLAASLLGITSEQAQQLFFFKRWGVACGPNYEPMGWPKKFESQYVNAKTPRGRANATVRRIEHFISTNGAE
jgi:hypothetical protein